MSQEERPRPDLIRLDLSAVSSLDELHAALEVALGFPGWYGRNWNAFWDAITGLVPMPRVLVIEGWPNVVSRWPEDAKLMIECLRDLNQQYPNDACEVQLASAEPPAA